MLRDFGIEVSRPDSIQSIDYISIAGCDSRCGGANAHEELHSPHFFAHTRRVVFLTLVLNHAVNLFLGVFFREGFDCRVKGDLVKASHED